MTTKPKYRDSVPQRYVVALSVTAHCVETWRHPQNRKYISYRNIVRGGSSHGTNSRQKKIGEVLECGFRVMREDS